MWPLPLVMLVCWSHSCAMACVSGALELQSPAGSLVFSFSCCSMCAFVKAELVFYFKKIKQNNFCFYFNTDGSPTASKINKLKSSNKTLFLLVWFMEDESYEIPCGNIIYSSLNYFR